MKIIFYLFLLLFGCSNPAYAYIDPGTGSFVVQILVATAIGILISIKSFWINIKTFFINIFSKNNSTEQEPRQEKENE